MRRSITAAIACTAVCIVGTWLALWWVLATDRPLLSDDRVVVSLDPVHRHGIHASDIVAAPIALIAVLAGLTAIWMVVRAGRALGPARDSSSEGRRR